MSINAMVGRFQKFTSAALLVALSTFLFHSSADAQELADAVLTGKATLSSSGDSKAVRTSDASTDDGLRNAKALTEILTIARQCVKRIDEQIVDYSCVLIKRERVNGQLGGYQYMTAKVRHHKDDKTKSIPFSLYLRFHQPDEFRDREVLYVDGFNAGKIIAKKGGDRFAYLTSEFAPESEIAMRGNRYPITEFGVQNLAHRLLEIAENESFLSGCDLELRRQAKVDGRVCVAIVVTKRERTADDPFSLARVFIDKELMIPIHFESFGWLTSSGKPRLLEQYTYRNLKLNVGFSGADFDRNNSTYGFRKTR
ncbi:MAG: DUF1571 domain-containing protein [Pirellulaceae bacterium]